MPLNGSHEALYVLPQWSVFLVLALLTWGVVFVSRDRIEGLGYNVSYASVIGDMMLIAVILIAASVLQRGPLQVSGFWVSGNFHLLCLLGGFVAGASSLVFPDMRIGNKTSADIYHGFVVVPMYIYLIFSLAPIVWIDHSSLNRFWMIVLLLVWVVTFFLDVRQGRLDQPQWLKAHNVTWTKPVPVTPTPSEP